ncbi:DUF6933 domain-containing protein [Paenibacillus sp. HJGM_3]|uniref:DUF6933 domain-containing protein n=1 Tax=Paenibacillus sp. HJGM_3 TaxID=3379816 RepID=UPI00385E0ADF
MFVLRLTQTLLKDMKATPSEIDEMSPLLSWHANIYALNNRKHIIFINDLSRLCVIIDGVRSSQLTKLKEKFSSTLLTYLINEGIKRSQIDLYLRDGSEITIAKTNSRSVLGTMKEITIHTTDTRLEFKDPIARMKWLNRLIYKPIEYQQPIKVFKEAIQNRYS